MDQDFKDLIEASSLGTPAARRIRSSTPSEVVDDVRRRMEHRRALSLTDAEASGHQLATRNLDHTTRARRISGRVAVHLLLTKQARNAGWLAAYRDVQAPKAERLRAQHATLDLPVWRGDLVTHPDGGRAAVADVRQDQASQQAQIEADMARGSRQHHRVPWRIRSIPKLVLAVDFGLLLYFFGGITGVNWGRPFSAGLAAATLLAAVVTALAYGFLGFAGSRLRGHKDHSGSIAASDLDGLTLTACGTAAVSSAVIAGLVLIGMRAGVLAALGPRSSGTALMIALVLAVVSLAANYLVVAIHALGGSAQTARLDSLAAAVSRLLGRKHQLNEQAAVFGHQIDILAREGERYAAEDITRIIARQYSRDRKLRYACYSVVRARGVKDDPEQAGHGTWRGRRDKRRPEPRKLTCNAARVAAAVLAIAAAVAVTVFGVRSWTTSPAGGTRVVIAATATANEPAPALSADVLQMLRSAGVTDTGATAYVISPSGSQPTTLSLTSHQADGQADHDPGRAQFTDKRLSAVQQLLEHEAANGPLDLLATLAAAVKAAPAPATLIVVSSGLSTAGGFDLRQVGWAANPSAVAAQLKDLRLLPDLTGYDVVFSGLGDTAGLQPALPLPQRATLTSYWTAICQASGAASCKADETARPELASYSTTPVPVVQVPTVTSVTGPAGILTFDLPETLLFSYDSEALLPSADEILQPLALKARSQHPQVSITGYASPDGGTAAYNLALSVQRANAVRARLISLGLPASQIIKVTGVGTAGQNPSACLTHGQLDEGQCAQLRRVVVLLSPAKAKS